MIMDQKIGLATSYMKVELSAKSGLILRLMAAAGISAVIVGLIVEPQRTLASSLLTSYYMLGIGIGAALLIALTSVSNAGWATAFRRIPEALTANVYAGGFLMILLLPGVHHLYEWSHPDVVAADAILKAKSGWLNVPFFSLRTAVYCTVWTVLSALLVRTSRLQDRTGDPQLTVRNRRNAGVFIVVYMLTFWMASMDWLMSLEPHWFSTIYGIYNMTGTFLAGLAAVAVGVITLRRKGYLREFVRDDHLVDLGRLIFAFSTFWM